MRATISRLAIVATLAMLALALLGPAPASAAFEQVGCFAGHLPGLTDSCKPVPKATLAEPGFEFSEEVQLGGTGGMAVNYTGNGGVPAGTVYVARWAAVGGAVRIVMYAPKVNPSTSERELEFALSWEVTVAEGPYDRCGPTLTPPSACPPKAEAGPGKVDVDVDQSTGNLYAYNSTRTAGRNAIVEYDATGSGVIARFGELAPAGKTTAETPSLVHDPYTTGGLAVNNVGYVYIYDTNGSGSAEYHRLMKFRPKTPGVFTEYEYAGTGEDLGAGFKAQGHKPERPVTDASGNVYVAAEQKFIEVYDATKPGAPPVCSYEHQKGGITALAVDPVGGTPFFFSYKTPKRIFRLGACNPATGHFEGAKGEAVLDEIPVAPERDDLYGLALDPVAQLSPTRPAGILYGAAPNPTPSNQVGTGEPDQSSLGYIFAPAEEAPPEVEARPVTNVGASSAQLHAVVDPKGFATTYAFQYLSEAEYEANPPEDPFQGASEAPLGGAPVPGTSEARPVSVTLTGLAPDTAYRYRAVARSFCSEEKAEKEEACEILGEAQAFRTFPPLSGSLPDGRAWELVSPAQKNGGQVLPADPSISSCGSEAECKPGDGYDHFPMQSSPDGDAVVYEGTSFDPQEGVTKGNSYVARRDPAMGWRTANLMPASLQAAGRGYAAFDASLSVGLLGQTGPSLSPQAPPDYKNLYTRASADPFALATLLTAPPPNRPASGGGAFEMRYAGAAEDFSRVFFEANDVLTGDVPGIAPEPEDGGAAKFNLYEWERATGQLRLVNVFPGNATTEAGTTVVGGQATHAEGVEKANSPSTNAVSADGRSVFFSDEAGQVYAREDASLTRQIPDSGEFSSASTDGARVLLANGHLYDLQSEETTDLSEGEGGFEGIAGQSEDLSRIYFVDTAVLTGEEANSEGQSAQEGKPNLYAWSEGDPTSYVATLSPGDNSGSNLAHSRTWAALPSQRSAQASPAGRYLAFLSTVPLTGYDNSGLCESDHKGGYVEAPCPEVFLYDADTGELSCPSCNPSGARPLGFSTLRLIKDGERLPQPSYLTDSGRLYFDSQDSLTLADTNHGVEDVYEYEPNGIGSCKRAAGCASLISAGTGTVDSNFLAIDSSAKNVFFTSRDRLVQRDKDELIDLYVAREGSPPPAETETTRPECQGEACQPAASAPAPRTPASEAFRGAQNLRPATGRKRLCPKGRHAVVRKGKRRCTVRRQKHAHRSHAHNHPDRNRRGTR